MRRSVFILSVLLCGLLGFGIAHAEEVIYEAENATLVGPVFSNTFFGYTGTGYAEFQNTYNDYIRWTVVASAAGQVQR